MALNEVGITAIARRSPAPERMRDLVAASRRRSARIIGSPDAARPCVTDAERGLQRLRETHPLAPVYEVLDRLLIGPAREAGLIVAVTDANGRLVWVEGDGCALRDAERMAFVSGADWSERAVGTSAPGVALETGHELQVVGSEHFAPAVHAWSCSAIPVHDARNGAMLGAVDVTGDESAVGPHALPLLRAAVAAVEAALHLHHLGAGPAAPTSNDLRLRLLGRDRALLEAPGMAAVELSPRHSELLLLIADHPRGLAGPELAALLYPEGGSHVTLRAEVARLRTVLARLDPSIRLHSRPYRLDRTLRTDAADVVRAIGRGAHRQALRDYAGPPLPASGAPGVDDIRRRTSSTVREAVLGQGNLEAVLAYLDLPEGRDDPDANLLALRLLPARSPKRAAIVARLASLEA